MTHRKLEVPDQLRMIGRSIQDSKTYIEHMAADVRELRGADYDNAIRKVAEMAARMEDFTFAQYQGNIAKLMDVTLSELKRMVRELKDKKAKPGKGDEDVTYTMGGYYDGYFVDYTYDYAEHQEGLVWKSPDDPKGEHLESGYELNIGGKRYRAAPPTETILKGGILLASKLGPKRTTQELAGYLEAFMTRVFLFDNPIFPKIAANFALETWIYDCFFNVPYLRATGDPGSGKTEMMRRVGLLCYRTINASGSSSTASIFRMIENYNPTLLLDEMDLKDSDVGSDKVQLLKLGFQKDGYIFRVEKQTVDGEEKLVETMFRTFCPKLFTMQDSGFKDPGLNSRCFTFNVQPKEAYELKAAKIDTERTKEMLDAALALRNMLMTWRLTHWQPMIAIDQELINTDISLRLNQIMMPLIMISKDDEPLRKELNAFMVEYNDFLIQDKEMDVEARILEAMWKIYLCPEMKKEMVETDPGGFEKIKVGHITQVANEIMKEMNMDDGDDDGGSKKKSTDMTTHKVGRRLRNKLQFRIVSRTSKGFFVVWDESRMRATSMRFGVKPEEIDLTPFVKKTTIVQPAVQPAKLENFPKKDKQATFLGAKDD